MKISIDKEEKNLTIKIEGRLDTTTAPKLETSLKKNICDSESLVMDFADLDYVSSAGLRVILTAHKMMGKQGNMVIKNVNETVMEIFEITGFAKYLTIE